MSGHALYFWVQPVPSTLDETSEIYRTLESQSCRDSRLFLDFARQLTARFPEPMTDEDFDPDSVWSDGPVVRECDTALFGVGLSNDFIDKSYPEIVAIARRFGLVTYDPLWEVVFLPSGAQIGDLEFGQEFDSTESSPKYQDSWKWDRESFGAICREQLEAKLNFYGFEFYEPSGSFRSKSRETSLYISLIDSALIIGQETSKAVALSAGVEFGFDKLTKTKIREFRLFQPAFSINHVELIKSSDIEVSFFDDMNSEGQPAWLVENIGSLKCVLKQNIWRYIKEILLPILTKCGSSRDLNRIINHGSDDVEFFNRTGAAAILAFVVDDSNKFDILNEVRVFCSDGYVKCVDRFIEAIDS